MKFFVAFAALVAVAVASPVKRPTPIAVGPAIVDTSPVSIGPAIVDFPVAPSPVVVGPIAPGQPKPLVQLIVNVNGVPYPISISDLTPEPVQVVDEAVDAPVVVDPVHVVDLTPIIDPVQVVDLTPIIDPVQVVDVMPVEPVQIGTPIIPSPAVNLPEELN